MKFVTKAQKLKKIQVKYSFYSLGSEDNVENSKDESVLKYDDSDINVDADNENKIDKSAVDIKWEVL